MAIVTPEPEARPYEHLVLDFLAYLEFERGLSRNTLEAYRSDLLQFGRFLEQRGADATAATATEVGDFLAELAEGNGRPPASPATIHRKTACLRSFYRHLRREGLRESDPTASITGPRRGRRLPKVLNRDEVAKLLSQPKGTAPTSLRDRALLELMYACGLRASEAIGIEVADLDMEEAVLRARGKGSKERVVPVGRAALEATRIYLERGRPALVHQGIVAQLFVNFRGEPLTRQGLYKIVRRHAATAGLAACGCGALPDASEYGDEGTNTLAHVAEAVGGLELPTLQELGLGNVTPIEGVPPSDEPVVHGRLHALGPGKDTTAGHWEMMGVAVPRFPTYPDGFPQEVITEFSRATGRAVIGNAPSEGLRAIEEHGELQLESGALIVYTSQDSVFQVAAHVDAVPV